MSKRNYHFDCQIYIPATGLMSFRMPAEAGPRKIIRLRPLDYDELIEPGMRRLLAAFESVA
jgi:hypothetical protein